jgi:hypothetical protein
MWVEAHEDCSLESYINKGLAKHMTLLGLTLARKLNPNIKTEKSKKYYNKYSSTHTTPKYILSKGYGKQLLRYVEQYLKDIGIEYIVLTPMSKPLIDYYTKLGYSVKIIPNNSVDKLNNNEMQRTPNSYVSENIIMYKKL